MGCRSGGLGSSPARARPSARRLMGAVLLDTTVLIDALRGRKSAERVRELRRRGDEPYVCGGIAEERQAGNWRRSYAMRGQTLTQADCLVAAAALGVGARLATANVRDFPL